MSQPSNTWQGRKLDERCTYPGCNKPPLADNLLCEQHAKAARERKRKSQRRLRAERRKQKRCPWCGRGKRPDRYACPRCLVSLNRAPRGVNHKHEDNTGDLHADRMRADRDGRMRFRGQAERGHQPPLQLDRQDLRDARRCLDHGEAGLAYFWSPEIQQLTRTRAAEVRAAAVDHLRRARGWIDDVLARNGVKSARPSVGDEG